LISRFSEVVEKFPALRPSITEHLIRTLPEIKSGKVYRGILWILGEYVESANEIVETFQELRKVLGEIPILAAEQRLLDEASVEDEEKKGGDEKKESVTTRPKVLADGTYATETAYSSTTSARLEAVKAASKPPLRSKSLFSGCTSQAHASHLLALLLGGDFFTGAVLAAALTKLVLRFANLSPDKKANSLRAEAMLIMTSTIRVGQSKFSSAPIDEDSNERIMNCIQTLSELEIKPVVQSIFLSDTKAAYSKMVAAQEVCMCCLRSLT
jgi:coatomer subunit beta